MDNLVAGGASEMGIAATLGSITGGPRTTDIETTTFVVTEGESAKAMNLRGREEGARPELDDVASLRGSDGGSSRSYVVEPTMDISPALTGHHKRDSGPDEAMVVAGALGVTSLTGLDDKSAQGNHLVAGQVAAPLTKGSSKSPGVNPPGRRQEDDVNLVSFHLTQDPISSNGATPAMSKGNGDGCATIATASTSGVRRLVPVECERLMSWPDGWTAPPGLKAPDSRRYAACGDGVVSNVAEWIGRRMLAIHAANQERDG